MFCREDCRILLGAFIPSKWLERSWMVFFGDSSLETAYFFGDSFLIWEIEFGFFSYGLISLMVGFCGGASWIFDWDSFLEGSACFC